jgi:prepilin-type processing-associated H-X9-DG protein
VGGPARTRGFYAQNSYGGNAGTRGYAGAAAADIPLISRDGLFFIDSEVRVGDITDGTSNTLLFGERHHHDPEYDRISEPYRLSPGFAAMIDVGSWGWAWGHGGMVHVTRSTPVRINYRVSPSAAEGDLSTMYDRLCAFGSGHPGGANFAFADGSVRFLSDSTRLDTLQALSTRAGGEVVTPP